MNPIMALGVLASIYGFFGLFGMQYIPKVYRNRSFTKQYAKAHGKGWLLLGLPCILLSLILQHFDKVHPAVGLLCLALFCFPSIMYDTYNNQKFMKLLSEETNAEEQAALRAEKRQKRSESHPQKHTNKKKK